MLLLQQTTCTSFYCFYVIKQMTHTRREKVQQYREKTHCLTVSLLGSSSFRILKKFLPNCLNPLMKRFCKFFIEEERREKEKKKTQLLSVKSAKPHRTKLLACTTTKKNTVFILLICGRRGLMCISKPLLSFKLGRKHSHVRAKQERK